MKTRVLPTGEVLFRCDCFPQRRTGPLNSFPEFIRDDPEVRTIFNPPLASRVVAHDATPGAGFMLDRLLTPIWRPK